MADLTDFTQRFEEERPRLRAVAYRMLGSAAEAEDAVQDTWLRASAASPDAVDDLRAWLTTIVARVSLNRLRSRATRREDPLEFAMPDPVLTTDSGSDPEHQAVLADSVGIALLVVLETLTPAERLAFVLHDLFAVPFDDIATMIDRSPAAARQLASRARQRVQGRAPAADASLARQRELVDAFFAAARNGDFEALVAVLHPEAEFRAIGLGPKPFVLSGAETVASNARMFGAGSPPYRHAVVNGGAGVIVVIDGVLQSIAGFTIVDDLIFAVDVLADPARLAGYDVSRL